MNVKLVIKSLMMILILYSINSKDIDDADDDDD